jgi:dolichyl-phosphate beta-glucosyltransferase
MPRNQFWKHLFMDLSIVIPAYNEERRLTPTLEGWSAWMDGFDGSVELVVSDDGSRDGTPDLVEAAAARDPRIRLNRLPHNRGKGGAVRSGMLAATGDYRFYVDADMNIAPSHVEPALAMLRAGVADVVTGKRSLAAYAETERSVSRLAAGAAVQATRRSLLLPVIRDTQCGFKGFTAPWARKVFAKTTVDGFAFDVEVLFVARRMGARIVEMPVEVDFRDESTFDVSRHLKPFLGDIWRVRKNAWRGRYS